MKVGIFYNSISNPAKFSNKTQLMDLFAQGVNINGDTAIDVIDRGHIVTNIDAGFVLGYTLENNFRKKIIDMLFKLQIPSVFVDSNILHYNRKDHNWHRYSLDGVYPTAGTYFFGELDREKWSQYSTWHNVAVKPWRVNGTHILIFCQRPKGWNMRGNDQNQWLDQTIANIRQFSNRPIRIRLHPGDGSKAVTINYLKARYATSVAISYNERIQDDLDNCWCAVGYNSTPNAVAAIEGVPVCLSDPSNSWAKDVAFSDFFMIENPPMPDRSEWIHQIANIHWSNQEVSSGHLWRSIRSYIERSR